MNDPPLPIRRPREATHPQAPGRDGRPMALVTVCALALLVGIVGGFGAVVFRTLIGFMHNLLFLGQVSFAYDSTQFTPMSPWGALVILVPVLGAVGVTFIVNNFAPEARGHGVPEVMDAIYYQGGVIRPIVAVAKSLASALAIGSGASVGREGPIIQIGSAMGSTLGQILPMAMGQRVMLVAAGAGAGIAATFNTPIGGVLFAIELMMPEISVNTFLPVAIATGTATFIGRWFFGSRPSFVVPQHLAAMPADATSAVMLLLYMLLGVVIGVAAAAFVRGLQWTDERFSRVPGTYPRHMLGMLLVGLLMYGLMVWRGNYYIEGVGYSTIQALLGGQITIGWFLLLLCAGKLFATCVSLGSGSSGGIFSPSLFMGGALGGAFAGVAALLFPTLPISAPAFAMVGMGAMVGSATGAAMTAVVMVFEMTRDYDIVLPMVLAVAVGLGIRRVLSPETIYTMKLARRGHMIPHALHVNLFLVRKASDAMDRDFILVDAAMRFADFLDQCGGRGICHVVVRSGNRIVGVLRVDVSAPGMAAGDATMGELARRDYTVVRAGTVVFDVIRRLWRRHVEMAIVVAGRGHPHADHVVGVITKEHIADEVARSIRIYTR